MAGVIRKSIRDRANDNAVLPADLRPVFMLMEGPLIDADQGAWIKAFVKGQTSPVNGDPVLNLISWKPNLELWILYVFSNW